MQDYAPGHAARYTREKLIEEGIILTDWPPFSPDLNLIECVWKLMKQWIQDTYGARARCLKYGELREGLPTRMGRNYTGTTP